jgi:hypothetical protein
MQKQLGKGKRALKLRGQKIALGLLEGKTQEQALMDAGYSPASARNPSEILDNPVIQQSFQEILEKAGLSDDYIAEKHRELIDAKKVVSIRTESEGVTEVTVPDYTARARGLDMYYKVSGRYVEKQEVSGKDGGPIQIEQLTDDELTAIIIAERRGN